MCERIFKAHTFNGIVPGSFSFWKEIERNFRLITFQVISIITTTGFGTKDIGTPYFGHVAKQLFLSEASIKRSVRLIFEKLSVHNRSEAVAEAYKRKLI